jgi:hypothetical protein
MDRWVEIEFDCLPLRSVTRLDIPLDASPKYSQFCERLKSAIAKHGTHNAYYLHNVRCVYHLLNHDSRGTLDFTCEGTVLTNQADMQTLQTDLDVRLAGETCDWLTEPVKQWFLETVPRAIAVEFDRYIVMGDLERTRQRLAQLDAQAEQAGGYLGMYL